MSGMGWRALVWLVLASALAAVAGVQFARGFPLQSNLLALLPQTERNPVAEQVVGRLADTAAKRVFFLIGPRAGAASKVDTAAAVPAALGFAAQLRQSRAFDRVVAEIPPFDAGQLARFYLPHRFGLLGRADRAASDAAPPDLGARLQRKLYSPFQIGPGYALADDPFGFADSWLADLPLKTLRLETLDHLLVARDGETLWVVVSAELPGSAYESAYEAAYDNAVQDRVLAAIDGAEAALRKDYPDLELLRVGTVFYAAAARQGAEREFDLIGTGSLIGMLLLLYLVFRSLRPLALGLVSVGCGVAAAATLTVAVYGELHLITLVFGASLIGEAIDYAIQYFAAHLGAGDDWEPVGGLRRIAPGLLMALTTSALGYATMLLAPFPALAQIALFALAGLAAACATVFLLLPLFLRSPSRRDARSAVAWPRRFLVAWRAKVGRRACLLLAALLLAVSFPGWLRLSANDDVRLLIARPPALLAQEERIRELTGFGNGSQFFLIEGRTAEELLRREEALDDRLAALAGPGEQDAVDAYSGVAAFVPSAQRQQQNRERWRQAVFADAAGLRQTLTEASLRDDIADRLIDDFKGSGERLLDVDDWLASPLSAPFRHLWVGRESLGAGELRGSGEAGTLAAVVQLSGVRDVVRLAQAAEGLPGVTFVDKAGSVSRLFGEYRRWGALWLLGALVLVYGVLGLRYGRAQAGFMLLPTVLSIAVVLGAFGYLGTPLTLFNLMGFMLVLGVGVNYAIFLREGGVDAAATLAGVLLSAGTTLLSFGLLAFSSMPALSGFGLTLLLGILVSVLLAPMVLSFSRAATT